VFSFFKKIDRENFLKTDIHSHLLPGIDDGVKSWEESLTIIRTLANLGVEKIITTPHVMSDYYENTPEIILNKRDELINQVKREGLGVIIEAAAEYYVDEKIVEYVEKNGEMLSFGNNYVLIETSFLNKPNILNDFIFLLQSKGYKPVLAHPERYIYIQENYNLIKEFISKNVLLQVNVNALVGYYSPAAKKLAEFIIKNKHISFLGSDIHNEKHLSVYQKAIKTKYFQKCRQLPILNNSL
jgi:protein-tyrosine phosphatase